MPYPTASCFTSSNKPLQEATVKAGKPTRIDDYDAVHSIANAYRAAALKQFKDHPEQAELLRSTRGTKIAYTLHLYVPNYSKCVILKLKSSEDAAAKPAASQTPTPGNLEAGEATKPLETPEGASASPNGC